MGAIRVPVVRNAAPYYAAQVLGLALTGLLLIGLVISPVVSLRILWDMVIPLLPAVFLINPMVWRNVCPLATINAFAGRRGMRQPIDRTHLRIAWGIGLALLVLLVPARRFLFNVDGSVLATTIVLVACLAAMSGVVFERRVAFCNGICPVLPVEKLYGQNPLIRVGTARCSDCVACTAAACLDLAGDKAVAQTLGEGRRGARWIASPFGVFALGFPGFVVGYFATANGDLASAPHVYLRIGLSAAVSLAVFGTAAGLFRVPSRIALPMLGALTYATYYWYAAPKLATAYGASSATWIVRALAATLLGVWLACWLRRESGSSRRVVRALSRGR